MGIRECGLVESTSKRALVASGMKLAQFFRERNETQMNVREVGRMKNGWATKRIQERSFQGNLNAFIEFGLPNGKRKTTILCFHPT